MTINTSALVTAGAISHKFILNNEIKTVPLIESQSFYKLIPSHLYILEVYSIGKTSTADQISDESCTLNITTSEY